MAKSTAIELPEVPQGKDFEDCISALFNASGFFVEQNTIRRLEKQPLFEIDVIITKYNSDVPETRLVEVKSSSWGFRDLFTFKGWMEYLKTENIKDLKNGLFIVSKKANDIDLMIQEARKINIEIIYVTDIKDLKKNKVFSEEIIDFNKVNSIDFECWRYVHRIERILIKDILKQRQENKINPKISRFHALFNYYHNINNDIFFVNNITDKVRRLYNNYLEYPRITAKCAHEITGDNFEEEYGDIPKPLYEKAFFDYEYNELQLALYLEQKARLTILKYAIEHKLYENNPDKTKPKLKKQGFYLLELPQSFLVALKLLSKDKYFERYPIFWQWYLWLFGGFILKDYLNEEYKLLSEKTGIPTKHIDKALKVFDILFPQDSWFYETSTSNITCFKMHPFPFRGIGAHYRKLIYTKEQKYDDLKLTGNYTLSDLINWNNACHKLLYENKKLE